MFLAGVNVVYKESDRELHDKEMNKFFKNKALEENWGEIKVRKEIKRMNADLSEIFAKYICETAEEQ